MDRNISEAEIDQLADLARNSGTHYQIRIDRRRPRGMNNDSPIRRLLQRIFSALKF